MDNASLANLAVSAVVLVWLLVRQLTERPLKEKSRIGLILVVVGAVETLSYLRHHPLSGHDAAMLLVSLLIGVGLAAVRAFTVRLSGRGGQVMRQGTWLTGLLWIVSIGQHFLIDATVSAGLGSVSVLLYFGVVLLAQQQVLTARTRGGVLAH
ncbi:hypothetical protein [Streptomyces sp. NBC_01497]|uniref:hypothetical protein n=1 Tax=Streptomyces sp. NBC_01497 TaxID=2903885 RepID=UPI002E32A2F3|nr:hypothetical protein [Streptomyces sp. NBC_01497]